MAAISTYALISTDEFREALQGGFATGADLESTLASVCNKASAIIERHLNRQVVTRGSVTGYITPPLNTSRLYLREWPVTAVASVYEDSSRAYATPLVNNTDYIASMPAGEHGYISRVFPGMAMPTFPWYYNGPANKGGYWLACWRAVKVTYTAGYATTALVPDEIKLETLKLAVKIWAEWKSGMSDIGNEAGPMGHFSRLSNAFITDRMKSALYPFKRPSFDPAYEERDTA